MDKDFRDRYLYAVEEARECERIARCAANKAKFIHERMMELYKELNTQEKEETDK